MKEYKWMNKRFFSLWIWMLHVDYDMTTFVSGWSGAMPNLARPNGIGRRSIISTWTESWDWKWKKCTHC